MAIEGNTSIHRRVQSLTITDIQLLAHPFIKIDHAVFGTVNGDGDTAQFLHVSVAIGCRVGAVEKRMKSIEVLFVQISTVITDKI